MSDITISEKFVQPSSSNHGELPLWDEEEQLLIWVDMEPLPAAHCIHHLDPSTNKRLAIPNQEFCTGFFFQRGVDKFHPIIGTKFGWSQADIACGGRVKEMKCVADIRSVEPSQPDEAAWKPIRLNEATSDAKGRIWFATCAEGETSIEPSLYFFDPSTKALHRLEVPVKLTMSNAMVFSPDSKTFYLGCSIAGKVWSFDCDLDAQDPQKMLSNCKEIISLEAPAAPDGMTCDTEGRLYLAIFNGGRVNVYPPTGGNPLYSIHLPAQSPTCPAFAGKDLDQLIVTTHAVPFGLRKAVLDAGVGTADELEKRWPDRKGGVYRIPLQGVRGLAQKRVSPLAA